MPKLHEITVECPPGHAIIFSGGCGIEDDDTYLRQDGKRLKPTAHMAKVQGDAVPYLTTDKKKKKPIPNRLTWSEQCQGRIETRKDAASDQNRGR